MKLSFNERRQLIDSTLRKNKKAGTYPYVRDVWDDRFVYSDDYAEGGKAWEVPYSIDAKTLEVTFGDGKQVLARTVYETVKMDALSFSNEAVVSFSHKEKTRRRGKIFEAGDYTDKGISFTEEDLRQAAADFKPVPINIEHTPTVLDGKCGELVEVEVSQDGKTLFGVVELPSWLDTLLSDTERKVSTEWGRITKKLEALALTTNPRVADAALMAAFSGANPPTKGTHMGLFDDLRSMIDNAERQSQQPGKTAASFSDDGGPLTQPTTPPTPVPPAPAPTPPSQPTTPAQPSADFSSQLAARDSRIAALEASHRASEAGAIVDRFIFSGQFDPNERADRVADLVEAVVDDSVRPVKFGATQQTRAERLVSTWQILPKNKAAALLGERVGFAVLPTLGGTNQEFETQLSSEEKEMEAFVNEQVAAEKAARGA